jgi:uncharacterized membrane protein
MTNDTAARPGGSSFKLRLALMVSLALNVLIIGAVAGAMLVSRHHGWHGHGFKGAGLAGFARTLPPDRGDAIREKLKSNRAALAPLYKEEQEARDAARSVLMTEPFDVEKFKAALERAVDADVKEKRARMELFAETAASMTPEERRQLHNWFEERRKRFRRHHDDDEESAPPPPPPPEE